MRNTKCTEIHPSIMTHQCTSSKEYVFKKQTCTARGGKAASGRLKEPPTEGVELGKGWLRAKSKRGGGVQEKKGEARSRGAQGERDREK